MLAEGPVMGMFDQTARQASKVEGEPFFAWALSRSPQSPPLKFERWDDTRRLVVPGEPDRTNDLVAVLRRTDAEAPPCFMIVEVESEPERVIFQRVGLYEMLLSLEVVPGAEPGQEPMVGAVVLNLTGRQQPTNLEMPIPGTSLGTWIRPIVINLCDENAQTTLAAIEAGELGISLLPWVPLMAGGGKPKLIERWTKAAERELVLDRRAAYRDWALVFAELSPEQVNWQQALEGWQMQESQVIRGWINRGKEQGNVERGRADVLRLIRKRLADPVPEALRLAVEGTNDLVTLERWFDAAIEAKTLADLRAAMKLEE
jgi:hypothetical protein